MRLRVGGPEITADNKHVCIVVGGRLFLEPTEAQFAPSQSPTEIANHGDSVLMSTMPGIAAAETH